MLPMAWLSVGVLRGAPTWRGYQDSGEPLSERCVCLGNPPGRELADGRCVPVTGLLRA